MPTMSKTGREEISRRRLRQNWQRKEARAVYWRPEIHFLKKARQVDLLPEIIFCFQMVEAPFCFVHSTFVVKFYRLYTSALGDKILSSCLLYTCTTRSMVLLDWGLRGIFII